MLGKTPESRDTVTEKSSGEQEPENLKLALPDQDPYFSPWYRGRETKSELQTETRASNAASKLPEKFFKSPPPQPMWICSVARNLFWFGLVCLLSFPSDSHPQLSFRPPEPRRASWGSHHLWFWDSSVPRSEPFLPSASHPTWHFLLF